MCMFVLYVLRRELSVLMGMLYLVLLCVTRVRGLNPDHSECECQDALPMPLPSPTVLVQGWQGGS